MFIIYCVFSKIFNYILNSGAVSVCTGQCLYAGPPLDGRSVSRDSGRVKKNDNISRKKVRQYLTNILYIMFLSSACKRYTWAAGVTVSSYVTERGSKVGFGGGNRFEKFSRIYK